MRGGLAIHSIYLSSRQTILGLILRFNVGRFFMKKSEGFPEAGGS